MSPKLTDEQVLRELSVRPDARTRERISCEICGNKDHVKLVKLPAKIIGGRKIKGFGVNLCSDCRGGKKSKKKKGEKLVYSW